MAINQKYIPRSITQLKKSQAKGCRFLTNISEQQTLRDSTIQVILTHGQSFNGNRKKSTGIPFSLTLKKTHSKHFYLIYRLIITSNC